MPQNRSLLDHSTAESVTATRSTPVTMQADTHRRRASTPRPASERAAVAPAFDGVISGRVYSYRTQSRTVREGAPAAFFMRKRTSCIPSPASKIFSMLIVAHVACAAAHGPNGAAVGQAPQGSIAFVAPLS